MSQFKLKIVQKLVPGLRKEGYTEEAVDTSANAGGSNPPRAPNPPPARPQPQTPPYAPEENPYRLPSHIPPRNPLEIGRRDLDPFPSSPFGPPPLFPQGSGDGMFVGPDHPIFGGGRGRGAFEDRGPWGGDGYLPPMGAPPGSRFDPVGPVGPGFPGRGGFGGLGPRRGPPRGGQFDPDNDEFMPPGAVSPAIFLTLVARLKSCTGQQYVYVKGIVALCEAFVPVIVIVSLSTATESCCPLNGISYDERLPAATAPKRGNYVKASGKHQSHRPPTLASPRR